MQNQFVTYKILLLACWMLFFQGADGQRDKTYTIIDDIDKDGKKDYVEISRNAGTSMESFEVTFKMGNSKKEFTVAGEYHYGSFICLLPLPDEVTIKSSSFLKKLSDTLLGVPYHDAGDPAIQWFKAVTANKSDEAANKAIDFKSSFNLVWNTGTPAVNKGFSTVVDAATAAGIIKCFGQEEGCTHKKYLAAYYANNHQQLNCGVAAQDQPLALCTTNHGAVLRKGNSYAWLFINDIAVFGFGSEKLRWPSLKSARLYQDMAVLNITSNTSESGVLYVVDISSGKLVRLNNEQLGILSVDDYTIENGQLQIKSAGKTVTIAVKDIL